MIADYELQLVFSGLNTQVFEQNSWIYYVFVLPAVTSMAVSVFQMVLSFWIKPVISYICILAMYVFSAYYIWFPFGNYSMLLRSLPALGDAGYTVFSAVLSDAVLLALSVSFGLIYFKKYTILGKVQGIT